MSGQYDDVDITPQYIERVWRSRLGKVARRDVPFNPIRMVIAVTGMRASGEISVLFMSASGQTFEANLFVSHFRAYEEKLTWA